MYERPFLSERVFDIGSCLGVWKDVLADGKRADVSQAQPQPSRSNIISFRLTRLYQQFSRVLSCSVHKADVPARYVRLPLPFPKSKKKKTERGEKEIINKSTQVWWIDKPPVGKRIHLISNSIGGGAGFFFRRTNPRQETAGWQQGRWMRLLTLIITSCSPPRLRYECWDSISFLFKIWMAWRSRTILQPFAHPTFRQTN